MSGQTARILLAAWLAGCLWACSDDDAGKDGGATGAKDSSQQLPLDASEDPEDAGSMPVADSGARDAGTTDDAGMRADSGVDEPDAGPGDAGAEPPVFGGMTVDIAAERQDVDLFGEPGHRIWLQVSDTQLEQLNQGGGYYGDDIYVPGSGANFADHVVVQDVETESVADYGKMEIDLVGESTYRQWSAQEIPNIRVDTNEFQMGVRIDGFEHIRLNNGLVGSIFREAIAHRIYRELGYPALRASFAFLGSNVWGEDIWVPMTLIEVYKRKFCDDNQELLGGDCENMWEFPGSVGGDGYGYPGPFPVGAAQLPPNACQVKDCDDTRLLELIDLINATEMGPGFADAVSSHIDWDFHQRFQCLSWIMWTGDDPLHNSNNNLIIERDDGKLIWAPYSVDISAGQDWYTSVTLTGSSALARGCQLDPECWSDTLAACEQLIEDFDDLDPEDIVDETEETLDDLGMMRDGDEQRAKALRQWFVDRQAALRGELERYRHLPDVDDNCPDGLLLCYSGTCGTEEQCALWQCNVGLQWCESTQGCYSPSYDYCPICEGDTPYYCDYFGSCVASADACPNYCSYPYVYCPAYGGCVPLGSCPFDEDSGAPLGGIGGFGGMGGFAGMGGGMDGGMSSMDGGMSSMDGGMSSMDGG